MAGFVAGKLGSVSVGTLAWRAKEWSYPMKADLVDVTNFSSGGFREKLAALIGASVRIKGNHDTAAMAMTCGSTYTITLGVGGGVSFSASFIIDGLTPSTNVEGAAEIEVSGQTTGTFTAAIA